MSWNEEDDDNDPWTGRKQNKQNPSPNLNTLFKKLQKQFVELLNKPTTGQKTASNVNQSPFFALVFLFVTFIFIWGLSGFFIVQQPEQAVVLRFGAYTKTFGPGLHWLPRVIDSKKVVNVQRIYAYTYPVTESAQMLTKDENIVDVSITVKYRIENARNYLFNVKNPEESLRQASASALRQVIGRMNFDDIITTDREVVLQSVKKQLEDTLSRYNSGILVTGLALKSAKAPEEVQVAFDDVIKAREDEQRYINQAQAYLKKVEPLAKGQAERVIEEANAYKTKTVLQSTARTYPFLAILTEYKKAPSVTRERLYLDALEKVLSNSSKILVDVKGANNMLYLPINELLNKNAKMKQLSSLKEVNHSSSIKTQETTVDQGAQKQSQHNYGDGGKY